MRVPWWPTEKLGKTPRVKPERPVGPAPTPIGGSGLEGKYYPTPVDLGGNITDSLESIAASLATIAKAIAPEPKSDEETLDPETRHRMRTKLRRDEWRNNASA